MLKKLLSASIVGAILLSGCASHKKRAVYSCYKINKLNQKRQIQCVSRIRDGDVFYSYLKNPSKKVTLALIRHRHSVCGESFTKLKNVDKEIVDYCVEKVPRSWEARSFAQLYYSYLSNEQLLRLIKKAPSYFCTTFKPRRVEIPKEIAKKSVLIRSCLISCVKNPDKKLQLLAVQQDARSIKWIENPDKEVQLSAVNSNPEAIKYIKNPSEEIQLAAVRSYPESFKWIKNPTKKVILEVQGYYDVKKPRIEIFDKNIKIYVRNGNVKIANLSNRFINVISIAEYSGENIYTHSNISLPPQSEKTLYFHSFRLTKADVYQNRKKTFGYAVEYSVENSAKKSLFETKKYASLKLFNDS